MPYRPLPAHRRNVRGVIYPLTAAVARLYGIREDGAYPIGAFYTVNIDSEVWEHVDGIWYRAYHPEKIADRNIREEDIELFLGAILSGHTTILRSKKPVQWEPIPEPEVSALPLQGSDTA
jgi:hypothetical protein